MHINVQYLYRAVTRTAMIGNKVNTFPLSSLSGIFPANLGDDSSVMGKSVKISEKYHQYSFLQERFHQPGKEYTGQVERDIVMTKVYTRVSGKEHQAPCRSDRLSCLVVAGQPGPAMLVSPHLLSHPIDVHCDM